MLSTYDGDQITAEEAWNHYTTASKNESAGVSAISVGECESQQRTVIPDPDEFQEHVNIDFTDLSNSGVKDVAKIFARLANKRGWRYQPPQDSANK